MDGNSAGRNTAVQNAKRPACPATPRWDAPRRLSAVALCAVLAAVLEAGCARQTAPPAPVPPATYTATAADLKIGAWQSELPADIVLALDQSGSMSQGAHPTDPGGLRARDSVSLLEFVAGRSERNAPNRFGVVNFGTTAPPSDAVPLTPIASLSDPSLARLRQKLHPENLSDTSFISALRLADGLLRGAGSFAQPRNRAIVIFTDGQPDDARKLSQAAYFAEIQAFVDRAARPAGVRVFVVGIDTVGKNWSASAPYWRRVLGADQVFTATDFQALQSQFNQIVQRVYHLPEVPPTTVAPPAHVGFAVDPYLAAVEFHIFPGRQGATLNVYRPDGKRVQPGRDPDAPPVRRLSTFQRMVVYQPQPGDWHYEASGGRVVVLRNPIPLHMALVTPARVHPRGKPMALVAQFQRADGQPVRSEPDYPLGLSAEVVTPSGQRIPVKFPLENARGSLYAGEPAIEDTMTGGDWKVSLKVNGGGKYEYRYPVTVQVRDVPYLLVDAPGTGPVLPGASLKVRARLMRAGKPLAPQGAFGNHPDQLVMAQVSGAGKRADKVFLSAVPGGDGNAFAGTVPMPSAKPGAYTLAVALAPEERSQQAVADETVRSFAADYPPPPWWRPWLLWGLPALLLAAVGAALLRRRRIERLRLPFYYWAEGRAGKSTLTFTQADEDRPLEGVPVRVTRVGGQKRVRLVPTEEARLLKTDGTPTGPVETDAGGLLRVQSADGSVRSLSFGFEAAGVPRPQPAPVEDAPVGADWETGQASLAEREPTPEQPAGGGSEWDIT